MSFACFVRAFAGAVALTATVVSAPHSWAQTVETVRVGQQTKRAFGTIVAMASGDIACHLTLKDDRGARFEEMALFEICDRRTALLNRRVALKYTMDKTMSPECQGDTSCKKTQTVVLVSEAKPVASVGERTSFCTPAETVVFACRFAERMVSVCGSRDASAARGYLEYRFGDPGSNGPPELSLPRERTVPAKAATGENVPFSGGGGSWLRFAQGPFAYTVYSGVGKWGPKGEIREKNGVVVERSGKQVASLKCAAKTQSFLSPDWFERMAIKSKGQDFDFPD